MTEFEESLVALGISAATAFSLPKSVGALYGLASARAEPQAFDDFHLSAGRHAELAGGVKAARNFLESVAFWST